jgi:hypothetical protein
VLDAARSGLDIYLSPGEFAALKVPDELRRRFRNAEPGHWIGIGPWQVRSFGVDHDSPEPLGFVVAAPDGDKLVYITDASSCGIKFDGATHFAVECNHDEALLAASDADPALKARIAATHMSLEACLAFLGMQDMGKVREIHLLHLSDRHSDEDRFKRAVEVKTGRPVIIAARGKEAPIPCVPPAVAKHEAEVPEGDTEGQLMLEARLNKVAQRKDRSGATVLVLTLDGLGEPVYARDPAMHGFLLSGRSGNVVLSTTLRTSNGKQYREVECILKIGETWFKDNEPYPIEDDAPVEAPVEAPVDVNEAVQREVRGLRLEFDDTEPF